MPDHSSTNSDRGFPLFVATLALLISIGALLAVAFKLDDNSSSSTSMMSASQTLGTSAATEIETLKLVVKSDEEHGKMGSDGNWHDAFLPGDFSVKPGATVKVTVYNYDEGEHTFTAPGLETNATIAAGSESKPAVTTFTFHAPQKAGRYEWFCALPCDPWAMSHDGFMRGYVSVA
ncbi:MAG TPA: cupredoxin domain-containing protein [Solirubrobacterales bacterium]|nr:cupredoxin domain-containing protein [Solirubrobacterales bacterium]